MKIGIGIDTGGTCTDAVIYEYENRNILAYAKANTTKSNLSIGIGKAIDKLPRDLVERAHIVSISTTLATNACVENRGGRAKLVMFGVNKSTVLKTGKDYGISSNDEIFFIESKTKMSGEIVKEPDWNKFKQTMEDNFRDCDSLAVVEMYAKKSGAVFEKRARQIVEDELDIPVVCGYELFTENNIIKRGASALLNARLIPVITDFLTAIKNALNERNINAPFVIVRSDGSLMTEEFTLSRPVETLLSGPVSSVMGAVELADAANSMVIDMGGTTTDIAFIKNGLPQNSETGIRIGQWNTFVKGLFVDTFGLGGDSGVSVSNGKLLLEEEKVIPLCMAANEFPSLLPLLKKEDELGKVSSNQLKEIYLGLKDISSLTSYSTFEKDISSLLLNNPLSLEVLGKNTGYLVMKSDIKRLIQEGVIIRCGVTPTDVMHVKGDFSAYNRQASLYGINTMSRLMDMSPDDLCDEIYNEIKRKLFFNIVRIMIEDKYPDIKKEGLNNQMRTLINDIYDSNRTGSSRSFIGFDLITPAVLVGVGAPIHVFLEDMGKHLNTKVVASEYSKVANALGAAVCKISLSISMEVELNPETQSYTVFGFGERLSVEDLEEAKLLADELATEKARREAIIRGADENLTVTLDKKENSVSTEYGTLFIGYSATAKASGNLRIVKDRI